MSGAPFNRGCPSSCTRGRGEACRRGRRSFFPCARAFTRGRSPSARRRKRRVHPGNSPLVNDAALVKKGTASPDEHGGRSPTLFRRGPSPVARRTALLRASPVARRRGPKPPRFPYAPALVVSALPPPAPLPSLRRIGGMKDSANRIANIIVYDANPRSRGSGKSCLTPFDKI